MSSILSKEFTSFLNNESIPYPLPSFHGFPISNSKNKELLYLYLPREQVEYMKKLLNPEGRIAKHTEVLPKLNIVLFDYFNRVFKDNTLEKRIEKSYSDEMKNINVYFSIILKIDRKFKKKQIYKEQKKHFRGIHNIVKKNSSNLNQKHNYFEDLNPSPSNSQIKLKKVYLPKIGNSLKNIDTNNKNNENEDFFFDVKEESILSNDEMIDDINDENADYKLCLENLIVNHLNDFRKDIVQHFLQNKTKKEITFEEFVYYIEFFVMLFTGLRIKYYIDEMHNLNLDFYASEKSYMNIAETFHYQVQFRIKDITLILQKDGTYKTREGNTISLEKYDLIKDKEIIKINKKQYKEYNNNHIEFFPPFTHFVRAHADKFRRYDINDNYHICEHCCNLNDYDMTYNLSCSSVFKKIDKCRLTFTALSNIINLTLFKTGNDKNSNKIIKKILYLPNYESMQNQIKFVDMIKIYTNPFQGKESKSINKIFRDCFGEFIGFYFSWMSHFIKWLIFPSIIGLIYKLCKPILIRMGYGSRFFLHVNLIFDILIVIWANYYVNSWKKKEKVYNIIWGMDRFKLEKENNIILNEKGDEVELFMGVKIPIYDNFHNLINSIINIMLTLLSLIGTMLFNLFWFYIEKINLYDAKNPFGKINNPYWLYIIPVMIYITREILSKIFIKINKFITENENYMTKKDYKKSMLKKQLTFEFFNYYFNLYYIAFAKRYFEKCAYDDCFTELGNQLTIIIISDITVLATKSIYYFIYKRKLRKKFENIILEKEAYSNNSSKKYRYYTRSTFGEHDISTVILPVIFNFGYIVQFGVTSKISFLFMFLLSIFFRILTGFNLKYLLYLKSLYESNGIGIFNRVQKIMAFLAIISNLGIIFYSNKDFNLIRRSEKFFYFLIYENIIIAVLKLMKISYYPNWYEYKSEIEIKYLKKYAIRGKNIKEKKINKIKE